MVKNETLSNHTLFVYYGTMMIVVVSLSGCLAPALLGVKDIRTAGGTQISFITGADIGVSMNGTDTVDNNRGIKPETSLAQYQAIKADRKLSN